ncbi:MAG: ABC transporter ATP-binding protein [Gemmatimonadaceae bacterium]|nr:ABC transporter ATP-binding protein [Gemmatimonadaceae bacterium]
MDLRAEGISRRFGRVQALDGVSFGVGQGEVVGVIGPNGSGKSTLLACVAGLDEANGGRVLLDGAEKPAPARRRALFYLPDGIAPWRDQRAAWVLDFASRLYGAVEPWRGEVSSGLALGSFARQRIGELSKGQRKRVLLAVSLLVPRPVVFVDEPFDGLDPRQARAYGALVRERATTGRSFVLSIHAMSSATRTCDRHVLLHEGRVVADGTVEALREKASLPGDAGLEEIFLALT